ncbi:WD repeat-containing protein 46-like [Sinocyclocheilus anshuiensis]|uniref:WD repeat-containing protein 46-like n=1 Tax=Sinocyclocheilus anshuiensis TaxID=1608454 RepID=UPI0007B7D22C|nr:PREDICTED: WD repeat-containing protein 46-like [Sinocyclocheilus anshuiensis]
MCQPAGARRRLKEAMISSEAMSEHAQKQAARYDLLLPEDPAGARRRLKEAMISSEAMSEHAQKQAARYDLLLPEDAGFHSVFFLSLSLQYFSLHLSQFGPYRLDYSRTGRHLLVGGKKGHVACIDWQTKDLMCEMNVMETVNDVKWLHTEAMFAVAQKRWLYIYDSKGVELHCVKKFNDVLRMQFLPYHFLLATAVRQQVLLAKCRYMVTSGLDRKLKVYDIRAFKPLHSCFLPAGASCLSLSQRGLLSAATGDIVQVYQNILGSSPVSKPYMAHRLRGQIWGLAYCPFEDVLGIGHGEGFTSMIVPGAGEPNFDALDTNPYRSYEQRQEWEVKALLEKVQPELIGLHPEQLSKVDQASFEQRHKEQVEALGFDPLAKDKFKPKTKKKGRSSAGAIEKRKRKVAHEDQRDEIRQSVQERTEREKELKEKFNEKKLGNKSTLDRFRK